MDLVIIEYLKDVVKRFSLWVRIQCFSHFNAYMNLTNKQNTLLSSLTIIKTLTINEKINTIYLIVFNIHNVIGTILMSEISVLIFSFYIMALWLT